jgi:hypothetical protein
MPVTEKNDRTSAQAKEDAKEAINAGATKVTLERKENGNWDLKITQP